MRNYSSLLLLLHHFIFSPLIIQSNFHLSQELAHSGTLSDVVQILMHLTWIMGEIKQDTFGKTSERFSNPLNSAKLLENIKREGVPNIGCLLILCEVMYLCICAVINKIKTKET